MLKNNQVVFEKQKYKFVKVTEETHSRLGKFGRKEESYGDIVSRLLDMVEGIQ